MKQSDIKKILRKNNCRVWQLCETLGMSRNHYYDLAHHDFKGHERAIKSGIESIVNQKAGVIHAD